MTTPTRIEDKPWEALTPDEKMERRFSAWLAAGGINFESKQAEKEYKARVNRLSDALHLKKPDRVPLNQSFGGFATGYYGYTEKEVMYDPDKAAEVALRGSIEFPADGKMAVAGYPGKAYDLLDYKLFSWPGRLMDDNAAWQFNEAEYMKADEYDDFLQDPSDFWMRVHTPRIVGAASGLSRLLPAAFMVEQMHLIANVSRFGLPEVQATLEKFMQAGREIIAWQQKVAPANRKLDELGFPGFMGGICYAPFDYIGDTLRGTRGIITDMYRRPAKLLEALERTTPLMVKMGVGVPLGACPVVMIPLHKGADGFMSDEQFKVFYWPTLLKVVQGLNKEGLMVRLFAEGGYNTRLDVIRKDLSRGKTLWHFDYTDMKMAKEVLGNIACIMGNVPVALIHTGAPADVIDYCRRLIDTAGTGGGFILATGANLGRGAKPENIRAMIKCVTEYGAYK